MFTSKAARDLSRHNLLHVLLRFALLGLLIVVCSVHAHDFCVTSSSQLQGALNDASDGGSFNAEDNLIQVAQGTYATGLGPFHYSSTSTHGLRLLGGYNANCTAHTRKAALTILDGGGTTGVLHAGSSHGSLDVGYLTLQNGNGSAGGGLQVNFQNGVLTGRVSIFDNVIRSNHSTDYAGGLYATCFGNGMYIDNNLVADNSADGQDGGAYVTGYSELNEFINNTVTGNTSVSPTDDVGGLDWYSDGGTSEVIGNIFWNNSGYGLYLASAATLLEYNDYGSHGGAAPGIHMGNLSVDPAFVNAAAGNFRLSGNSPLLGASQISSGYTDLDDHSYPSVGRSDMGAYSQTIFVDHFDGPGL